MSSKRRELKRQIVGLMLVCGMATSPLAAGRTSSQTPQPSTARQQLLDVEKQWTMAEHDKDAKVLRSILDDKFVFVYSKAYDKAAFIKQILAGDIDPTESQVLSYDAVIIDADTAVVVGTDTEHGTRHGVPYVAVARYTVTYIRRHGHWRALAEYMVNVPQAK